MIKTREILPVLRLALSSGYNRGILSEGEQISRGNRNHCDSAIVYVSRDQPVDAGGICIATDQCEDKYLVITVV